MTTSYTGSFPGFKTAGDSQAFKGLLQKHLKLHDNLEVSNVEVMKTRALPPEGYALLYRVQLRNASTARLTLSPLTLTFNRYFLKLFN